MWKDVVERTKMSGRARTYKTKYGVVRGYGGFWLARGFLVGGVWVCARGTGGQAASGTRGLCAKVRARFAGLIYRFDPLSG